MANATAPVQKATGKAQKVNNRFSAVKEAKRQEVFKTRNGLGDFRSKVKRTIRQVIIKNDKVKTQRSLIDWSTYKSKLNDLTTVHNDWLTINFDLIKDNLVKTQLNKHAF